jgi:Domain of unknown function (DUF222)/HNH endonuclease
MFEDPRPAVWLSALDQLDGGVTEDADRLRLLRDLEELKAAACAAQARIAVAYADSHLTAARDQRQVDPDAGEWDSPRRRQRLVHSRVATELGHARRLSPHAGRQFLTTARALVEQMPCTLTAMAQGKLSEHRATILVRETACLAATDRLAVDRQISQDADQVSLLGTRALAAAAQAAAYRIDPEVVAQRSAYAVTQRRVSIRPAPDTMIWLTALLPVAQGVAAYAALSKHADAQRAIGDERARGQVMADTLVEQLTGQATASAVPVQVNLVMTDDTLLTRSSDPASLQGYGPIPADLARSLVNNTGGGADKGSVKGAGFWLRRLYQSPTNGELVAMDSTSRYFPAKLAQLIAIRDDHCRTPFCDAPIRHTDHITSHAHGGASNYDNGQGLCEACNLTKEAPGWHPPETRPPPQPPWLRSARHRLDCYFPPLHVAV